MTEFAKEYGGALYELCAEEGIAEPVWQELQTLRDAFRESPDFLRLMDNLSLTRKERLSILDETLKGRVHAYTLNFLRLLTERNAACAFRECVSAYEQCYRQAHQVVEAIVTTARPLTDGQRQKLIEKIRAMTGKQAELREKIDESLLGGVLLQMDGKRYDNTVKTRLEAIRRAMTEE